MLYRRKVLLSLVDEFGGSLTNTDCQKLLFLYCVHIGKNYYDFFPYKYGAFSQVLYADKRQLMRLGWLKNEKEYVLNSSRGEVSELHSEDQIALAEVKRELSGIRGNKLVRKVYLEFPRFASNSEIVSEVLSPTELIIVKRSWKKDDSLCLYTIGYEGKSIDYYLDQLVANNIKVLVDVRRNPISRKFGFSKTKLSSYVNNLNIQYVHMPELGIPSKMRKNLDGKAAYDNLFKYYRNRLITKQRNSVNELRKILDEYKRLALTCFEADHSHCHRHIIVDEMSMQKDFSSPIKNLV